MNRRTLTVTLVVGWLALAPGSSRAATTQLWIANAWGDDLHVYEVGSWRLLKRFSVGPNPHGFSTSGDGRTVYVSLERLGEPNGELLWIDPQTFETLHRIPVGPEPNEIETTLDGRFVYVSCADGNWWVIDTKTRQVIKKLFLEGRPHNTLRDPGGRYMYLSPLAPARSVSIVDVDASHHIVGSIPFGSAPRPGAISADGKTLYQQLDGLLGFAVADLTLRRVTRRVLHSLDPDKLGVPSRSHGLALRPDQAEIWSANIGHGIVHVHELTSGAYKQTAAISVEGVPYWISFTPDGRHGLVSALRGAPRAEQASWACAALALLGLPAGAAAWLAHIRRSDRRRLTSRLRRAILWILVWTTLAIGFVLYVRSAVGVVIVIDSDTKQITRELLAGYGPKRTQVVVVP